MTSINRVMIANRGEISVRVARALRDLGKESIAVYSDADLASGHRFSADYAVRLAGESATDTYLNIPALIDAAKKAGAEAIHPGYGFLSESSVLARAVEKAGMVFIGPTPASMDLMGHKIQARELVKTKGIPVVPGATEPLKNAAELKQLAKEIGYPLILKAASGGGGRGMRVVRQDSELEAAFASCKREALAYFGQDDVFCERYIDNPRHIEFQVLFDSHGNGVHLFERDCSVQRRHQKLVEEAPSTYLSQATREKIGAMAVAAGAAAGYRGAGTVEFICESPEKIYFMEMNTRIQVEHPVTEMITGVDLIAWQIRVAEGERLAFSQKDIAIRGFAIEARINAEDTRYDFRPSPGTIDKARFASGPFVRVDTHVYDGYTIPQAYDSMIAKLIVWGETREIALSRLDRALQETEIVGVPTTIGFHQRLLRHEVFRSGQFDTGFLAVHGAELTSTNSDLSDDVVLGLSAALGISEHKTEAEETGEDIARSSSLWRAAARREGLS